MKKVWQVFIVFCCLATSLKAEMPNSLVANNWVDSIFQKLTIAEQVGQLIDLRVAPHPDNLQELVNVIVGNHIGSITITGGDASSSIQLINDLRAIMKVPLYVTTESENSLSLPFESSFKVPLPTTFISANDKNLLDATVSELSATCHELGINGVFYNPMELIYLNGKLKFKCKLGGEGDVLFKDIAPKYINNNIVVNTDFHLEYPDYVAFSPKLFDTKHTSNRRENLTDTQQEWSQLNQPQSIMTIKSLPSFPESEAIYFYKKVISPLFWKDLEFGGILSADFDAIYENQTENSEQETIRTLLKIGSDKIVLSSIAPIAVSALNEGINERYFKQNEIKDKVKRILRLKYMSGLSKERPIDSNHLSYVLNHPNLRALTYQVYSKAIVAQEQNTESMPFVDLESTNFASLSLGFTELKVFQETLEKYAPFVHYMIPDISFDPYELNLLTQQLVQFDHVIIGLHTSGLVALDPALLNFLKYLNSHTKVVLVFLGPAIDLLEFEDFKSKVYVNEDNLFTQQIASQEVFGALDKTSGLKRLSYGIPEAEGMDSRVLRKIDEIIDEAISMGATPGCQVLIARNGSVIMEKGYGYYTYDSIMPVDTRTIYDLASITKVAATNQAIMKLYEQGSINLDSTLGAYLPELEGSNKASLVIRDVLSHQSGLRAFYPFWRNTIEDEDQTLYYYKDKPNETYANTVAYGMFAAEDLKDSLWNWTIETKLRRKKDDFTPYDYKYSDLGFYLLQVLVERVTDTPLDIFVDSVFYRPMGMSALAYNPLCKYPLKRMTPTERDTEFRHVLVWGTVHDQIAAMKGGVSGHAGLFGNTNDVAKIMQMHLQDGMYGGKQYLNKETVEKFRAKQFENSRRGLGWDKPEKGDEYNPASRYSSFDSFGHSGFTGTVTWADPTFNLVFVFLSNRIYPSIENNKLSEFEIRKRIHDLVYESMWSFEKQNN